MLVFLLVGKVQNYLLLYVFNDLLELHYIVLLCVSYDVALPSPSSTKNPDF